MRVRPILTAISALGLLTVLTACSGGTLTANFQPDSTSATAPTTATAPIPTVVTTTRAPATVPNRPKTTQAAPAADSTASFTAELDIQRQDVAMIMLTNTSKHSVTVRGWSNLVFSNQLGDPVSVPTQHVDVPGPGPAITVVPGGSVFAPVEWTDGDKADDSTIVADGVQVTAPGTATPVDTKFVGIDGSTPDYYEFDLTSIKIGTFQSSTHNLLDF